MQISAQLERLCLLRRSTTPEFETAKALLAELDNPQSRIPCIHVAGTNGKGSTCAMLAAILRQAGLKTALYTSPHLVRFNERCQINGENISDERLSFWLEQVESAAAKVEERVGIGPASFFDLATAVAFSHFWDEKVDIAVIETGLGGRWDATNVITPLASVITSIGLDHTSVLGNTVSQIAAEKAGIIKPGVPVIISALPPEAEQVIMARARDLAAPLISAVDNVAIYERAQDLTGQKFKIRTKLRDYGSITLPLLGQHQIANCSTAITTIEVLESRLHVNPEAIKTGLSKTVWPGRLQVISYDPIIIVDGAHNPESARALRMALDEMVGSRPLGFILSFMGDKDVRHFLEQIAPLASRCWIVELNNQRAMRGAEIAQLLQPYQVPGEIALLPTALEEARDWAKANGGCVCVTGSLYLAGEILSVL